MDNWRKIIAARMAELKISEGLTQAKLAETLGVSQGTVANWINGPHEPKTLKQFRTLETALKLPAGILTRPNENSGPHLIAENSHPYTPSINKEIAEKATQFLIDEIGIKGMERMGAAWVAETIVILYDLFSDPASDSLKRDTIMRMVSYRNN